MRYLEFRVRKSSYDQWVAMRQGAGLWHQEGKPLAPADLG